MDAEKMTITLDTEDMRTVLASVGFAEMWEAIYQNILQQMKNQGF